MCQALTEGGRRCPAHRHDSLTAINLAVAESGMEKRQVEDMFTELRREGRSEGRSATDVREWTNYLRALKDDVERVDNSEHNRSNIQKAFDGEINAPDKTTFYALRNLRPRAAARATALQRELNAVAEETNRPVEDVVDDYEARHEAVDVSRGAEVPAEYTASAVEAAQERNLPSDRASLVALAGIRKLDQDTERPVVQLEESDSAFISKMGYDPESGRMEVMVRSVPNAVFSYKNVSSQKWWEFSSNPTPEEMNNISSNPDHRYASAEEDRRETYAVQCSSCGQFRSVHHTCPEPTAENVAPEASAAPVAASESTDQPSGVESAPVAQDGTEGPEEAPAEPSDEPVAPRTSAEAFSGSLLNGVPHGAPMNEERLAALNPTAQEQMVPERFMDRVRETQQSFTEAPDGTPLVECEIYTYAALVNSPTLQRMMEESGVEPDVDLRFIVKNNTEVPARAAITNPGSVYGLNVAVNPADRSLEIVGSFSAKDYDISQRLVDEDDYDNERLVVALTEKIQREDVTVTRTGSQAHDDGALAGTRLNTATEAGTAEVVTASSTRSRRYILDASLRRQPQVRYAKAADGKRVLQSGKTLVCEVEARMPSPYDFNSSGDVDDQGYKVPARDYYATVYGTLAMRKDDTGKVVLNEQLSNLKCYCSTYRRNYNCTHVGYAKRHFPNVGQQMLPVKAEPGAVMDTVLAKKKFLSTKTDSEGKQYIDFSRSAATAERTPNFKVDLPVGVNPRKLTREEAAQVFNQHKKLEAVNYVRGIAEEATFYRALKRADVEVPAKIRFNGNGEVSGRIRFAKSSDRSLEIKTHTLKCNCPDYQANYDCKHLRASVENARLFVEGADTSDMGPLAFQVIKENNATHWTALKNAVIRRRQDPSLDHDVVLNEEYDRAEAAAAERARQEYQRMTTDLQWRTRHLVDDMRTSRQSLGSVSIEEQDREFAAYRENLMSRWEEQEAGYTNNPDAFFADYQAVKNNAEFDYYYENVLDGAGSGPGARKFGVELEFVVESSRDRASALNAIAREMHEEGLSNYAHQTGYHSGARDGWSKWSIERDSTVHGEIVSPLLSDDHESWTQLEKVCKIVKKHGGKVSKKVGSHVHVSSGSYGFSMAKHGELLRMVTQNEDLMYRMASNPSATAHRGSSWCKPNTVDVNNDLPADIEHGHHVFATQHSNMLNMTASSNPSHKKSHVEFRMWDGTLDPGVIQRQVMMSVAMTDAAERSVIKNNGSKKPDKPAAKSGDNRVMEERVLAEAGVKKHNAETFMAANEGVAEFFDSIFRRAEDRKAALQLFARTKWQKGS